MSDSSDSSPFSPADQPSRADLTEDPHWPPFPTMAAGQALGALPGQTRVLPRENTELRDREASVSGMQRKRSAGKNSDGAETLFEAAVSTSRIIFQCPACRAMLSTKLGNSTLGSAPCSSCGEEIHPPRLG